MDNGIIVSFVIATSDQNKGMSSGERSLKLFSSLQQSYEAHIVETVLPNLVVRIE